MMYFLIAAAVMMVIAGFFDYRAEQRKRASMMEAVQGLPGFSMSQHYIAEDNLSGIAIDEHQGLICLITGKVQVVTRVIPHTDIVSVELVEDGSSITQTLRGSQLGGAVVGELLFGRLGAVVGGMSGKTETTKKIRRIDLRLVVDDTANPTHSVCFMNVGPGSRKPNYKVAIEKARHWNDVIDILIRRADQAHVQNVRITNAVEENDVKSHGSVADELEKLAELRSRGVLTDDEFQTQKHRLLANS